MNFEQNICSWFGYSSSQNKFCGWPKILDFNIKYFMIAQFKNCKKEGPQ